MRNLICDVPTSPPSNAMVPILWQEMSRSHVGFWQTHIQPVISADPRRADAKWDWWHFFNLVRPGLKLAKRKPLCLSAVVASPDGQLTPVGMLLILTNAPHIINSQGRSVYTMFLSSAPKYALDQVSPRIHPKPFMGRALVDAGISLSTQLNREGRTWLHCAPEGGDFLMNFYAQTCQLNNLPARERFTNAIVGNFRANDGRYFFTNPPDAVTLLRHIETDHRRS